MGGTQHLISKLLETVYPVGSLFISVKSISPASFLGGEWEKFQDGYGIAQAGILSIPEGSSLGANEVIYLGSSFGAAYSTHAHYMPLGMENANAHPFTATLRYSDASTLSNVMVGGSLTPANNIGFNMGAYGVRGALAEHSQTNKDAWVTSSNSTEVSTYATTMNKYFPVIGVNIWRRTA